MDCVECGKRVWFFQRKIRFRFPLCPIEAFHKDCYKKYLHRICSPKSRLVKETAKELGLPCYDIPAQRN